jgi:hypothetical protein
MKAVFLILILGLALAFVLTGGRSADAQGVRMCADRSINGTPVHECYDGAQRNVTLSNNCGTIQMSAQALSDGDIPSIVPCPRTSSSSSRVAPQRHPDPGPTEDERKCQISVDAFSGDTPSCNTTTGIESCRFDRDEVFKYCAPAGRFDWMSDVNIQMKKLEDALGGKQATQQKSPAPSDQADSGHWFVIAGTYEQNQLSKVNNRMNLLSTTSITPQTIDTGEYKNLTAGKIAVVVGPTTKNVAQSNLEIVQAVVPDAFIKQGW